MYITYVKYTFEISLSKGNFVINDIQSLFVNKSWLS